MLIHYCVIAFKNIWKYKVSASISILGLAFALVCFVPILYWMDHETARSRHPDGNSYPARPRPVGTFA